MNADANNTPDSSSDEYAAEYAEGTLEADGFDVEDHAEPEGDTSEPAEQNTDEGGDGDRQEEVKEAPFHKHPRWKQMMDTQRKLREENARLKATPTKTQQAPAPKSPFDGMTNEQALEQLDSDPLGFLGKVINHTRESTIQSLETQKAERRQRDKHATVMASVEGFFAENADAKAALDSGEIEAFMNKNPGYYTPISAYEKMTEDARVEARLKEEKAKWLKEVQAKGRTGFLKSSPGNRGAKTPSESSGEGDTMDALMNTLSSMRS